jgi:hypothetical protein
MNNPTVKIYLQPTANLSLYYTAALQMDGTYNVISSVSETPINVLPNGWQDLNIKWDRHNTYLGTFTTQSQTLKFADDARAILLKLYYASAGGIQAECTMRVDIFVDVNVGYQTTYQCEINFAHAVDQKHNSLSGGIGLPPKTGEFSVPTLNAKINEKFAAFSDTQFNIPMWTTPDNGATWVTDAKFVMHTGIKLRYNATFISSATESNPIDYSPVGKGIIGFNDGKHGTGVNDGRHTIPSMSQYNIVQNNGTTTFIGNDILHPFLIQRNQGPGSSDIINERSFSDNNCSKPYTSDNYSLKHLLDNPVSYLNMYAAVSGKIKGNFLDWAAVAGSSLRFVLFEVDSENNASIGQYTYQLILELELPTSGAPPYVPLNDGVFSNYEGGMSFSPTSVFPASPVPVTLKYDQVYVFGIICDNTPHTFQATNCRFMLSALQFSIFSAYDSGASGIPINAPYFPESSIMGFTADQLLQKLVPMLNSSQSDPYGFPIVPAGTPFTGASAFLSHSRAILDSNPTRTMFFGSNSLQMLSGYPFISMSLNDLFKFCFNTWGCGLTIDNNNNQVRIEQLEYFFQNTSMLDLGTNVASMRIEPMTDFMACFLQSGYNSQDTNNDFGADIFCRELDFNTPLTKVAGTTLSIVNSIIADMYAMEKRRAQQVTSAQASSPSGQSNSNETYVIEFDPDYSADKSIFPPYPNGSGTAPAVLPSIIKKYPAAQSNNATLADYVYGLFYPDTAINLGLTPVKNMMRLGAYLRSMLDSQDSGNLTFRKIYQMLYNNVADLVPGIATGGLGGSSNPVIYECADIAITDLHSHVSGYGNQLFRPYKIFITTASPVNMWSIMSANPNRYISWMWKGQLWKGYVQSISQNIALRKPTEYELICHPDITNAMLINA